MASKVSIHVAGAAGVREAGTNISESFRLSNFSILRFNGGGDVAGFIATTA